ncbi:MAG: peptide-methionine (S)-S-oxide reductase MsrA [Acidobacteria bacterium]|nr:peptide-methionine (S)-S-oxide reductase MsrA [Acidobacteriota bacterium]
MRTTTSFVDPKVALPGRDETLVVDRPHLTLGVSLHPPFPDGTEIAYFGMGCFWGAERLFYELDGVIVTAVGYQGGVTPNPTYQEVCSGRTNHTESVKVVFDPTRVTFETLVRYFFENHDPTQGMRQGADVGTQYRSAIYTTSDDQVSMALRIRDRYAQELSERGFGGVTTEIAPAGPFYYAEEYHQQYLTANPNGYCGIGGTGVSCPVGLI